MPARNPVTTSSRPVNFRLSAAERRAAQVAADATKQSDLKREAAERRAARELSGVDLAAATPRRRAAVASRKRAAAGRAGG
jgi:hypothetical protein